MQVTRQVSVDALTGVLADLATHLKRLGEASAMQVAAELDLSFSQICTMFILDTSDHEPAVHELAERLGLSVAAAGRAVDALVREGLVARREDEHDRRVKRVSLLPAGAALIGRLTEAHQEPLRLFVERLSARERADLFNVLAPILARPEFNPPKLEENR
jgi:DNA-binding MarR family transcriptional regulator